MPDSNWDPEAEQRYMLALVPLMRECNEFVKSKLPAGIDFGLLVVVPEVVAGEEGRVLALTTDRERMAWAAAQWVVTVLPRGSTR